MEIKDRDSSRTATRLEIPRHGHGGLSFLVSLTFLFSTVAMLLSGFLAYQFWELRQELRAANNTNRAAISANPLPNVGVISDSNQSSSPEVPSGAAVPVPGNAASTTAPGTTAPANSAVSPAPSPNPQIQPGQFVQPALGTKAKVELLAVKRIKDPETGNRDVVNVQMRVRRATSGNVKGSDIISVSRTSARNPDTSETYEAVSLDRSTGSISLFQLRPAASADAYVWLRIPEGVNAIDIFIPETAAFSNVPIAN